MTDKSDIVPDEPLSFRANLGHKANLNVLASVYRDWGKPIGLDNLETVKVGIPWCLSGVILDQADKSDPMNQLHVYSLKIGETLAYKLNFTNAVVSLAGEREFRRMALMAAFMLGVEHAAEIRDAIAAERAKVTE
jgi:hypothetical protein